MWDSVITAFTCAFPGTGERFPREEASSRRGQWQGPWPFAPESHGLLHRRLPGTLAPAHLPPLKHYEVNLVVGLSLHLHLFTFRDLVTKCYCWGFLVSCYR